MAKETNNESKKSWISAIGQALSWPFRKGASLVRRFKSWIKTLFNKDQSSSTTVETPAQTTPSDKDEGTKTSTPDGVSAIPAKTAVPVGITPVDFIEDKVQAPTSVSASPVRGGPEPAAASVSIPPQEPERVPTKLLFEPIRSSQPTTPPIAVILPPAPPARPQQKEVDAIFDDIDLRNFLTEKAINSLREEKNPAELVKTLDYVAKQHEELKTIKKITQEANIMLGSIPQAVREGLVDQLNCVRESLVKQLDCLESLLNNLEPMTPDRKKEIGVQKTKLSTLLTEIKIVLSAASTSETDQGLESDTETFKNSR